MSSEFSFDTHDRELKIGDHQITLTQKEAEVLGYLVERVGTTVPVSTLEREVWGFRPGVRSQAVPVALRRLRAKLGTEADTVLQNVRGEGWRVLRGPTPSHIYAVPSFGTPFYPRVREISAIEALLEGEWRIVTLVGPGGAGKTRLAAEVARRGGFVWAALGGARSKEDLLQTLWLACGVSSGKEAGIVPRLGTRWLVLDEIELILPEVKALLTRLKGGRFLVTSREECALPEEAVHAVRPLAGDEARGFLHQRMQASRWTQPSTEEHHDRIVELMDGLPLGLEVAASYPLGLEALASELESGRFLRRAEGGSLYRAVARSYDTLDASTKEVLHALSLCDVPLTDAQIEEWLGTAGTTAVRLLASRSMVNVEGGGWRVLQTVRSFVRTQPSNWSSLEQAFDHWLFTASQRLSLLNRTHPRGAHEEWKPLVGPMTQAIDRVPDDQVRPLVEALALYFRGRGLLTQMMGLGLQGLRRRPDDAVLQVIARYLTPQPSFIASNCVTGPDWRLRWWIARAAEDRDPAELTEAAIERLLNELEEGVHDWEIGWVRYIALCRAPQNSATTEALEKLANSISAYPNLRVSVLSRAGLQRYNRNQISAAERLLRKAREEARHHDLLGGAAMAEIALAALISSQSMEEGAIAFEQCAAQLDPTDALYGSAICMAGQSYFLLGDLEQALRCYEAGSSHSALFPISSAMHLVTRFRLGETQLRDRVLQIPSDLAASEGPIERGRILADLLQSEVGFHDCETPRAQRVFASKLLSRYREPLKGYGSGRLLPRLLATWEQRLEELNACVPAADD